MSRFLKVKKNKKEEGITLIALITTIIVLLILAGITIGAITGSNGIIGQAQSAKEETEISQEKEIIDVSTVEAMGKNNRGNLEEEEFQNSIDKHTNGRASVSDTGEEFEVFFEETNRFYIVDKDGNILNYDNVIIDNSPGDLTKDENGNNIEDGKPLEIWSIEDLVEWSKNYTIYQNSNVILCRDLNFKSKHSYADSSRTDYGHINNDGITEGLMEEMQSGEGFTPIRRFSGTFEGNNKILENIYINRTNDAQIGLFYEITSNAIVKDLSISGTITSSNTYVGAIAGGINPNGEGGRIENCHNYSQISGNNNIGGIVGYIHHNSKLEKIINCSNEGDIISTGGTSSSYVGGIIGNTDLTTLTVENCFNKGNVQGSGITGNNKSYIKNCYNIGETKHGLAYTNQGKIANCYSIGNSSSRYLVSNNYYTDSYLYNCVYLKGTADNVARTNSETSIDKESCISMESQEMKEDTFISTLNQNLEGVTDIWVKDTNNINNGYPILKWQQEE